MCLDQLICLSLIVAKLRLITTIGGFRSADLPIVDCCQVTITKLLLSCPRVDFMLLSVMTNACTTWKMSILVLWGSNWRMAAVIDSTHLVRSCSNSQISYRFCFGCTIVLIRVFRWIHLKFVLNQCFAIISINVARLLVNGLIFLSQRHSFYRFVAKWALRLRWFSNHSSFWIKYLNSS